MTGDDGADSFLDLAREALADERVSGDDQATGQLLRGTATGLRLTDMAAGLAALERAVAVFDRAGRHRLSRRVRYTAWLGPRSSHGATTGTEDDELAGPPPSRSRSAHLDAALEIAGRPQYRHCSKPARSRRLCAG